MTETKQTPGPWVANNAHQGPRPWRIESDAPGYPNDGWIIGYLEGPDAGSNASLIAAAPDMLAALQFTSGYIEGQIATEAAGLASPPAHWETLVKTINAAIAKAGGSNA